MRGIERGAAAIGALEDGLRRGMYAFIKAQGRPVSRDEAARAVGISRKLAAFHLDKLVQKGLLRATYAHPLGRPQHQPGRSSKLYEPADVTIQFSVPERRYDLLAGALAETVSCEGADAVACAIAARKGTALGRHARSAGNADAFAGAEKLLAKHGFEPFHDPDSGALLLRNCPFSEVAAQAPELVCAMNLAFVQGVLEGLEARDARAVLEPAPGRCCTRLEHNH